MVPWGPWAHLSPNHKRRVDRFSRFCTADDRGTLTDRPTNHSVCKKNIPHLRRTAMRPNSLIIIFLSRHKVITLECLLARLFSLLHAIYFLFTLCFYTCSRLSSELTAWFEPSRVRRDCSALCVVLRFSFVAIIFVFVPVIVGEETAGD